MKNLCIVPVTIIIKWSFCNNTITHSTQVVLCFYRFFITFTDKVREANGCVLIHCLAGISRSPTVAIAYVMRVLGMNSDEAYRSVFTPKFLFLTSFDL